ncbi:MAG: RnfABCDGE type electron transport complex subunit D [Bacteroidetes bacterium]|nr:RnfABCDGE type electron transport complex subunit D [Bacteroidota bacterium]
MRFAFVSAKKKLETIQAPFFRAADRYYCSVGILVISLIPIYILAAGRLGYKILILLALTCAAGMITEMLSSMITKKALGYLGIGSWLLFPLMVPLGVPLWMSIIGFVISLIIVQTLFGGFGKHLFHPAVFAQLFLMINFTKQYNSSYIKPFSNPFFGLRYFSSLSFTDKTALKSFASGETLSLNEMFTGPHIGVVFEMFPYLILFAGVVYLLLGNVNYRTPAAFIITFSLLSVAGAFVLPGTVMPLIPAVLGGGTLFYSFFIFSDRWTSSRTHGGRIIAGFIAALITILIRSFSSNAEGLMFAALVNYSFSPMYDELGMYLKKLKRVSI